MALTAGAASSSSTTYQGDDFPIVCESCLGGNPYIRMLKGTMGKECRISGRPFNAFRWQGSNNKWKETAIAPEVAREKNCCQACLADLEYGVPFHVRDHVLEALGAESAPESEVNKEFWWANKRQKQQDGSDVTSGFDTYDKLRGNVDKLRAFAALDPGPIVRPRRETPLTPEEQERLRQRRLTEQKPPEDTSITSLYIGSVPPSVTKRDLMPFMLAYGELRDLVVDPNKLCAYVTFQRRADAEQACKSLYNNLTVKNTRLRVMWARRGKNAGKNAGRPDDGGAPSAPQGGAPPAAPPKPRNLLPPGVRLPPGVKPGAAYASTNPDSFGANPSV